MPRLRKQTGASTLDLDEIKPNRFVVYNPRANGLLKGEGVLEGRLFQLTTWRRDGLLARLRQRGFKVRTLADRIAGLPDLPPPPALGRIGWRPLTSAIEQFSHFDLRALRWRPIAPETRDGVAGVSVYEGWVLRRRKGRGSAAYYLAFIERSGGVGLRTLDETEAILTGYAQALALDNRPLVVERRGDAWRLPDAELPPPHHELLRIIAVESEDGPLVNQQALPLAQELFGRLGVRLVEGQA